MSKKILLVVNPISGNIDKAEIIATCRESCRARDLEITEFHTTGNGDIQKIEEEIETHEPSLILVAGGDGTVKIVAEAASGCGTPIGILPAGSANGLSVDLDLPQNIEENIEVAFGKHFMEIDMVCINGYKSIHLSDVGLNALLVKNYEHGDRRGMLGYAMQAVSTLQEQDEPFIATIKVENRVVEAEAKMIVIANSQRYGTGVTINPNGRINDGKFEIVILKKLDVLTMGKIITGNMPVDPTDVEIISTEKAKILFDRKVPFQVDGEYIGEIDALDVYIMPRKMKIAVR